MSSARGRGRISRRRFAAALGIAGVVGVAGGAPFASGVLSPESGGGGGTLPTARPTGASPTPPAPTTGANRPTSTPTAPATAAGPPRFDADRSYAELLRQVGFGPRVPGTRAHRECRDYLRAELSARIGTARLQPFALDLGARSIPMWNVLAEYDAANPRQVLLCAHWDTRPTADQEKHPEDRRKPIEGANDGASGVAVLLEIARVMREEPPPVGVRFALFDGEDYGPGSDRMYLGAKRYARTPPLPHPEWGVLLDMVGDVDLDIWRERNSEEGAPAVNDRIFRAAREARHGKVFHDSVKWDITDDHLPLLEAGVPVVDLIDFDYPHWHTLEDTADKCSPESLGAVGETVLQALYTS